MKNACKYETTTQGNAVKKNNQVEGRFNCKNTTLPATCTRATKKASKQASTQAREQKKHASKNSAVGKELNISYREYLAGQFENGDLFDNVRDKKIR